MITVAEYIASFLKKIGIKTIFGYQGSAMLKMLDEIVGRGISYVQNFNEQASGFSANGYARVIEDLGVAIATSGPGAVNLLGGISDAYCDSVPVMYITGQDYSQNLIKKNRARQNGFQDLDIVSMVKPITKYATMISEPQLIRYELEKAYYFAISGRKGPVLIDVPIDIQFQIVDEDKLEGFVQESIDDSISVFDSTISDVILLIEKSKKPVIVAGGGVRLSKASLELDFFSNKTGIPIVSTLNGLDVSSDMTGFAGLYGNTAANLVIKNADLIIGLGTRFAQQHTGKKRELYNADAKIIHIDIDESEIGRSYLNPNISIVADLKSFFNAINRKEINTNFREWHNQIEDWKIRYYDTICCSNKNVDPILLVREVSKYASEETVFVSDVGANQMWVAQALRKKGRQRIINSAGYGVMGFSLPASIGASYIRDDVISFMGDGGLQMNIQELNTLSLHNNNVKCFIFNNNNLGLMRCLQKKYYSSHFYGNNKYEFSCPNIRKLADLYNLPYSRIESDFDLSVVREVLDTRGPCLVDVCIDKDVFPLTKYDDEAFLNG